MNTIKMEMGIVGNTPIALDTMNISSGGSLPTYSGGFEVIPETYNSQTLQTKGMTMVDNVTVAKIPQQEIDNSYGGTTLIIGNEFY